MAKPMIRVHDMATDEIIDREMNEEEFTAYKADKVEAEARAKAEADKVAAKASAQAKLAALGLTEEEVASILG